MAPILTDCCATPFCAVPKANSAAPRAPTTPLCKNIPPPQAHAAVDGAANRRLVQLFALLTRVGTMTHEKLAGPRHDGMAWATPARARGFSPLGSHRPIC